MRISPIISVASAPPSAAAPIALQRTATPIRAAEPGTTLIRTGEPMPTDGPWTPAFMLVKKIGKDLLSLPGVTALSLNPHDANTVRLVMVNEYTAAIAQRVLEPMIDGVALKLDLASSGKPYAGPDSDSIGDCVHAVAAMPGVWNYSYTFTPNRGTATFRVVDAATISRLDPLIRDHLAVGPDKYGNPRTFDLLWRAGLT